MIRSLSGPALVVLLLAAPAGSAEEVTPERLLHAAAEPQNWLMQHGTYDSRRYSALAEIDRSNVSRLRVVLSVPLGGPVQGSGNYVAGLPVSPLALDGHLYVVDGWGTVSKIDAVPGLNFDRVVWQAQGGPANLDDWLQARRGLAFYRNEIVAIAGDGVLRWIDIDSGELVRAAEVGDPETGYTLATPPLVVGDTIIVGGGGEDRGARGQIDAVDARTGEPVWRTFTTPAPGEAGHDSWQGSEGDWRHGGGAVLATGSYDPETNLTYWPAGGTLPARDVRFRQGDRLYTNSTLALDASTGEIRWYFQYTPGDTNGFSEAGTQVLVPGQEGGAVLAHYAHNGFYYLLDAADGAFVFSTPYVDGIDWTAGIDPATGKPVEYDPAAPVQAYRIDRPDDVPAFCPNVRSVPQFAAAYSERTGFSYGAGAEGCLLDFVPTGEKRPDSVWLGGYYVGAANAIGALAAIDPAAQSVVANRPFDYPLHAGALATAGGIVFTTSADGTLHALDDETLETLASSRFISLTSAPPMTFVAGGEQLVAVIVGGNPLSGDLTYQSPGLIGARGLFVVAVLGVR